MSKRLFNQHLLFLTFAATIFLKTGVFTAVTAQLVLPNALWTGYADIFAAFWIGKLLPALMLGAFVYLTRHWQWWTIIVCLLIDVWILADLFYFKANGFHLTPEVIAMADNMQGFESSLLGLLGWDVFVFPLITISYTMAYFVLRLPKHNAQSGKTFGIILAISLLADCLNNYLYQYDYFLSKHRNMTPSTHDRICNAWPFGLVYDDATYVKKGKNNAGFAREYLFYQSIINYFPALWVHLLFTTDFVLTEESRHDIDKIFNKSKTAIQLQPKRNLVFILVESLESWPLANVMGHNYMPRLSKFIGQEHVFYANRVKSQIKYAISGDGQMINMTGLLPINRGGACFTYGDNTYPNFASAFAYSNLFNPCIGAWNQSVVTQSYGFQHLTEPKETSWLDEVILEKEIECIDTLRQHPFCLLSLTITSHIPFSYGAEHPKNCVEGMPAMMSYYLNSLAYTDSCIALVVDRVLQDSALANNTTIVITGDHTAFRTSAFKDMEEYATVHGIDFKVGKNYVPLIIYSPDIEGNERYCGEAYQMDIYPTVCALIDSSAHVPSFGVNLRDSTALANRPVTEEEAYRLSDLIIRSNYFGTDK